MSSDYRLSPAFAVRLVGLLFVLLAVVVFAVTFVGVLAGWSLGVVLTVGLAGLLVAGGVVAWLRRVVVVHFDDRGYRVRMVRGVGVSEARWADVDEAVPVEAAGEPCVLLRLGSGGSTTIPLRALATDEQAFVADLQSHLQEGHGLRPA